IPVFLILFLLNPYFSSAHWTQTDGPDGGQMYACLERNGRLFLGTFGGLYYSDNDGLQWQHHPYFNRVNTITEILEYHGKIIAMEGFKKAYGGYVYFKIHESIDNGQNWTQIGQLDFDYTFYGVKIHRVGDALCFVESIANQTIYRSEDGGHTWLPGASLPTNFFSPVFGDSTILITSIAGTIGNSYIIKADISYDAGKNWESFIAPDTTFSSIEAAQGQKVIAKHVQGNTIYYKYTKDLGQNWTQMAPVGPAPSLGFWGAQGDTVWASSGASLQYSIDAGQSWQNWDQWGPSRYIPEFVRGNQGYSILTEFKVLDLNTGIWTPRIKGVRAKYIKALRSNDQQLFGVLSYGILGSINHGNDWLNIPQQYENQEVKNMYVHGDTVFVQTLNDIQYAAISTAPVWKTWCTYGYFKDGKFRRQGKWLLLTRYNASSHALMDAQTGAITLVPPPPNSGNPTKQILEKTGDRLVCLDSYGDVWVTDNYGQSWTKTFVITETFPDYAIGLYVAGNAIFLTTPSGLFRSLDKGNNWTSLGSGGLPINPNIDGEFVTSILRVGSLLFASVGQHGVYMSTDLGVSWTAFKDGLETELVNNIHYFEGRLFVATQSSGVWERPLNITAYTGRVYLDKNLDGQYNMGDVPMAQTLVGTQNNTNITVTQPDGSFELYANATGDTLRPILNSPYVTTQPKEYILSGVPTANLNFAVYETSNVKDLSVDMSFVTPLKLYTDVQLILTIKNKGTVNQSPQIRLQKHPYLVYTGSSPAVSTDSTDWQEWILPNLAPYQSTTIQVGCYTQDPGGIDSILQLSVWAFPLIDDADTLNNVSNLVATIVGPFDPNDKQVQPEGPITPEMIEQGQDLIYTIRFQNTGNYPAEDVRLLDTLSAQLDLNSFEVLSSSHPLSWRIEQQRILEFYFKNIQLPDSTSDEPASHGFVKYKIRTRKDLPLGTKINNTAHIYFDFNRPITTNTTQNVVAELVLTHTPENIKPLSIVPNPA
ncbi:MAG: WD40/YVTN/BNR-like repeat-containing protein, partial [Saprospiraceae bacterium]